MSGKLDHVSKSWNNTERSARNASPPRSAIGRVPYAPKPPAAFTKSWNRPRPNPSARFKPISGPPHRRSCWPSRRDVAVPCTATLSTAPTSRVRSPLKTRTATRIYFIYSAVRHFSPRQIANFFSEVLTLGVVLGDGDIVLVHPERDVPLGSRIA